MALQNSTFHHECFIAIVQDATTLSESTSATNTTASIKSPIIYCNFIFPIGLNATVEIKDSTCSQFTQVASNTTIYNEGEATAVLKPTITQEERQSGTLSFTHEYCARIDILHDRDEDGIAESVLYNRFSIPITYRFDNNGDEREDRDGTLLSATVGGKERQWSSYSKQVFGLVVGLFMSVILVSLTRRLKRYRSNRRRDAELNDAEAGSVSNGLFT